MEEEKKKKKKRKYKTKRKIKISSLHKKNLKILLKHKSVLEISNKYKISRQAIYNYLERKDMKHILLDTPRKKRRFENRYKNTIKKQRIVDNLNYRGINKTAKILKISLCILHELINRYNIKKIYY